jgi:hypothetical protein
MLGRSCRNLSGTGHPDGHDFLPGSKRIEGKYNPPVERKFRYNYPIIFPGPNEPVENRFKRTVDSATGGLLVIIYIGPSTISKDHPASEELALLQILYSHMSVDEIVVTWFPRNSFMNGNVRCAGFPPSEALLLNDIRILQEYTPSAISTAGGQIMFRLKRTDWERWTLQDAAPNGIKESVFINKSGEPVVSIADRPINDRNDSAALAFAFDSLSMSTLEFKPLEAGTLLGTINIDFTAKFFYDAILTRSILSPGLDRILSSTSRNFDTDSRGLIASRAYGVQSGFSVHARSLNRFYSQDKLSKQLGFSHAANPRLRRLVLGNSTNPQYVMSQFNIAFGLSPEDVVSICTGNPPENIAEFARLWILKNNDETETEVVPNEDYFVSSTAITRNPKTVQNRKGLLDLFLAGIRISCADGWAEELVDSADQTGDGWLCTVLAHKAGLYARLATEEIIPAPLENYPDAPGQFNLAAGISLNHGHMSFEGIRGYSPNGTTLLAKLQYNLIAHPNKITGEGGFGDILSSLGTVASVVGGVANGVVGLVNKIVSADVPQVMKTTNDTYGCVTLKPATGSSTTLPLTRVEIGQGLPQSFFASNFPTYDSAGDSSAFIYNSVCVATSGPSTKDSQLYLKVGGSVVSQFVVLTKSAGSSYSHPGTKRRTGTKPPCIVSDDLSIEVPPTSSNRRCRLECDINFVHTGKDITTITPQSLMHMQPLLTTGSTTIETEVNVPAVRIVPMDGGSLLLGDFDVVAPADIILPISLETSTAYPESYLLDGKSVKYNYAGGDVVRVFAWLVIRLVVSVDCDFNEIVVRTTEEPETIHYHPSDTIVCFDIPQTITFIGGEVAEAHVDSFNTNEGNATIHTSFDQYLYDGVTDIVGSTERTGGINVVDLSFTVSDVVCGEAPDLARA